MQENIQMGTQMGIDNQTTEFNEQGIEQNQTSQVTQQINENVDEGNVGGNVDVEESNVNMEGGAEIDNYQEPQEEEVNYEKIVNSLGQSKIEEIYAAYNEINEILSDSNRLSELSKEDLLNLIKQKEELEGFIREIEPLMEAQKRQFYERVMGKFDEPVRRTVEEIFGNDLSPEDLAVLDTFISRLEDYYKQKYGVGIQTQTQTEQTANLGEIVKRENSRVENHEDLAEMLKSPDPKVREAAIKKMDEFLDKYASQYSSNF